MEMESPSAKLVLLAIANFADEDGKCWPSQDRLAAMTSQSVDSIQRRLKELCDLGLISVSRRARKASVYLILWSAAMKPQPAASSMKPQKPAMKPQIEPMMPQLCGIEPSIRTINLEPSIDIDQNDLDLFWEAYPPGRKTSKKAVFSKLRKIVKAKECSFEKIMVGVRRYADSMPDPKFTKGPLVWLNQGCWDDEITAGSSRGPSMADIAGGKFL